VVRPAQGYAWQRNQTQPPRNDEMCRGPRICSGQTAARQLPRCPGGPSPAPTPWPRPLGVWVAVPNAPEGPRSIRNGRQPLTRQEVARWRSSR
jgi:hypothetical protein